MVSKKSPNSDKLKNSQSTEATPRLRTRRDLQKLFGNQLRESDQDFILEAPIDFRNQLADRLSRDNKLFRARGTGLRTVAEQRERASIEDPLTGLYNRKGLNDFSEKEVAEAERYGQPLCMLMLDIDHFKPVNDTHGHAAGDLVLKEISQALSAALRKSDVLSRCGGEEFAVILPGINLKQATLLAEKLRKIVEQLETKFEEKFLKITISIGIAEFLPGQEKDDLIRNADRALYQAKAAGRNKVKVFEPEQKAERGSETSSF